MAIYESTQKQLDKALIALASTFRDDREDRRQATPEHKNELLDTLKAIDHRTTELKRELLDEIEACR